MGWFKKKKVEEKPPENTISIWIKEKEMTKLAENVMNLSLYGESAFFKKKKESNKKSLEIFHHLFSEMVVEQYPWIQRWSLTFINQGSGSRQYMLEVLEVKDGVFGDEKN